MPIHKQQFYEGAALHMLARNGGSVDIGYEAPFFVLNGSVFAYLKYSTRGRSPWGFTFMPEEQVLLERKAREAKVVIGLICGADGVAALDFTSYRGIVPRSDSAVHVACYRDHWEHYEVSGPSGTLARKVAPSEWRGILGAEHEA